MKKGLSLIIVILMAFSILPAQQSKILELKEKIIELQNNGELGFQNFTLCKKIFGFASYVPLSEHVLDKQGTLLVYYEPLNVFTNKRDGLYEIWYTQDMSLINEKKEVISHWDEIISFHYTTKKPVMDLFAQNSINLKGKLAPGKYTFKAVLKDKLGDKTATKSIEFEIR